MQGAISDMILSNKTDLVKQNMLLEMKAECLVKWRFPLTPDRAVQVRALAIVT